MLITVRQKWLDGVHKPWNQPKSKIPRNPFVFSGKLEHWKLRQFNEDQVRWMRTRGGFRWVQKFLLLRRRRRWRIPCHADLDGLVIRVFRITTLSCVAAATACQNGDHSSIKRHLSFNRKTTQSITNKGLHFDVFFSSPKVKIFLMFFWGWISPISSFGGASSLFRVYPFRNVRGFLVKLRCKFAFLLAICYCLRQKKKITSWLLP